MAFISNSELAKIENALAKNEAKGDRAKAMEKRVKEKGIAAAEALGAAAMVGAIRGKFEAGGQKFVVPGTDLDAQMLIAVGLIGGATFKAFGKYSDDAFNAGLGIGSAYAFSIGREFGKTGKLNIVAGLNEALGDSAL